MTDTSQKRILWIDEFKGFVLLLVCLFHAEQSFKYIDMGMGALSVMRMTAFFFISGVLFSSRRFNDFKSYARHRTKVLLIPYILLSLLFLALDPVVWNFDFFPKAPKMTLMNIRPEIATLGDYIRWNLVKIFAVGKSSIGSGPLWFVFTLYSISLIFFALFSLLKKIRSTRLQKVYTFLLAAAFLAVGWLMSKYNIRTPLGLERDCTCLAFFMLGFLAKEPLGKLENLAGVKSTLAISVGTVATLTLYFIIDEEYIWFSVMNNSLGKNFFRFAGSSLLGIAGLVGLFKLLSRIPENAPLRIFKGILRNISRNGLIVLAVHWWVLLVLRIVFKEELDKPYIAYICIPVTALFVIAAIPLFRCRLYKLIGKEKISIRESLSIRG
ncbi:MAG: acyltransferase [Fibrobacter sp.]|nr:acyltransferase [Fibrobacter sp.]